MGDEKKRPISFLYLDIQRSSTRDKPTLSEQHSIDYDDVWSTDLTNLDLERGKGNATPIFVSQHLYVYTQVFDAAACAHSSST